jgi:DNA-binding transcriptional LysR family regulator
VNNNHELFPDLRVFAAVIELGSFTLAARSLRTSTAAVSRSVKRLEEQVGVKLINRTTRRLGATDAGSELYARCKLGLRQLQSAISTVKSSRTEARGLLRVTCPLTFGRRFVAPAVLTFRRSYPDIEVDLSLDDNLVDMVEGGIDIAIRGGLPDDARLITRRLAPMPMYVCASPAYLMRIQPLATPADLRAADCIRFRFRSTGRLLAWEFSNRGARYSVETQGPLTVDDIEVACAAAIAGEGVAQLPGYVAVEAIREGRLKPVLLDHLDASRSFWLAYVNRSDRQPLRDTLFVAHLAHAMADEDPFVLNAAELAAFGGEASPH